MMVHGKSISIQTRGFSDIKNITEMVQSVITDSKILNGIAVVFAVGSTASISTMEFEPALVEDIRERLESIASQSMHSRHSQTWGDDNGFSHIRATFMGPGITVPISNGELVLGTWQQIVIIDHDNRPRSRTIFVQIMGDS